MAKTRVMQPQENFSVIGDLQLQDGEAKATDRSPGNKKRAATRKKSQGHKQKVEVEESVEEIKNGILVNNDGEEQVSMESMVSFTNNKLSRQFNDAIKAIKDKRCKLAVDVFGDIIKQVNLQPNYGQYVIYKRSQNKRTTLSALHMFKALAHEALCDPKKAIECCNSAINQDSGWPVPFTKRSEYLSALEALYLHTDGAGREEIARCRKNADIIVDASIHKHDTTDAKRCFNDLQEALSSAAEGDVIFLEKGVYERDEGFSVPFRCSIVGASSQACLLISNGNPTLQIFGTKQGKSGAGSGEILLKRLRFKNNYVDEVAEEGSYMRSNAAHVYVISPESVTIRDCMFEGGEEGNGGILVAEEAFYQSLLDLEFQNPELSCSEGMMDGPCLRIFIDFCIFSNCKNNCAVYANNQATVVISNSAIRDCGHSGLRAEEGSTLTVLNCEVVRCDLSCMEANNVSTVNVRGCLSSNSCHTTKNGYSAGLCITARSKANVSKSLFKDHLSAVSIINSDLVFEDNCVLDITDNGDGDVSGQGMQLKHSAIFVRLDGNVVVQRNNFHNCNLVFLIQQGANPTILGNNVETCLIGIICGARAVPRLESNIFQCMLMSIGMFIEDSKGIVCKNVFQYVANGLDIYRGSSPLLSQNTYTNLTLPGLSGNLSFDIQKVNSGKVEDMEANDIITLTADTDEKALANAILRRKATTEKLRDCSNCGRKASCSVTCPTCSQINYCTEICLAQDQRRHKVFCCLSLKDMF